MAKEKDISISGYNTWSQFYQIQKDDGDGVPSAQDLFVDKKSGEPAPFHKTAADVRHYYSTKSATNGPMQSPPALNPGVFKDYTTKEESETKLPDGVVVSGGNLTVSRGRYFIAKEEYAIINGVKIDGGMYPIVISFDGKLHDKITRGISFDISAKTIRAKNTEAPRPIFIKFEAGNSFIPAELKDNLEIELKTGEFVLQERSAEALIPKISFFNNPDQRITLLNGEAAYYIQEKSVSPGHRYFDKAKVKTKTPFSSAPFEINFLDEQGKILEFDFDLPKVKTRIPVSRLVSNNYGQMGPLPPGQDTAWSNAPGLIPTEISAKLEDNQHIYTIQDLHKLFPKLKVKGSYDAQLIKQTIDALKTLAPKVLQNLKGIDFIQADRFLRNVRGFNFRPIDVEPQKESYATSDGWIHLSSHQMHIGTFQHECAHPLTFDLASSKNTRVFQKEWLEAAGDVYNKHARKSDEYGSYVWTGEDEPTLMFEARHGCMRPYSTTSYREDVSTFVEAIWEQPEKVKQLLDQTQPNYDPRYQKKLDLLLKYGFISKEVYESVLSE